MTKKQRARFLSEETIDQTVIAQADKESAWGPPIRVRRPKHTSVALPADLAAQAAFFARLHRDTNVAAWFQRVVKERLDWEEAVFMRLKRQLSAKRSA
ncbi:MAG: hypothetical protein HZB35_06390 [Nitrospirae bacterium]|nr:hypothetical protein [Nitrospirota bacterium]